MATSVAIRISSVANARPSVTIGAMPSADDGIPVKHGTIGSGSHQLHRIVVAPSDKPIARLAILHGYGDHPGRFTHFMEWMAAHNIPCHAIDFRGHGQSTGKRCHIER